MKTNCRNLLITILLVLTFVCGTFATLPPKVFAQGQMTTPAITSVGGIEVDQETNMGGAPSVLIGQPYSAQVVATGGNLTYSAGAGEYMKLPQGLTIDSQTGLISGTCTDEVGRYNCLIKVANTVGEASAVVGITVGDANCIPVIETASGLIGQTYKDSITQFTVRAVDNSASLSIYNFKWSLKSGELPNGMYLNYATSRTLYINGTPTQTGTFNFELEAKNDFGNASREFSITVVEGSVIPSIIETGESLTHGVVGKPLQYQLEATGTNSQSDAMLWSNDQNDFSKESYDLGNGLVMSKTGLITGTPQTNAQVNFVVYAKNSKGMDSASFYIIVHENGEATSSVITPQVAVVAKGSTKEFTISLDGYGDVQQVAYWSFYMWDNQLGSAYPTPTDSELSVNTTTPSKTVTLTVGKNETRGQIRVVAYSKLGNNGIMTYATVTVVEKSTRDAKSVAFFDTASNGTPKCAINDINPYLVNGVAQADGTLGQNGCTAYIDTETGTLYLKDYNGGPFAVLDEYYNQLEVVLQGDNVITNVTDSTADRYGIYSKNGLIEITSATGGTLTINVTNTDSQRNKTVYGIAAGYASGQTTGKIKFGGNATVTINVTNQSVYEIASAKTIGIFAYDGIYFLDSANVNVTLNSVALGMTSGLIAVNSSQSTFGIEFNTTGDIVLDNSAPKLNTYSELIQCTNVNLINVGMLKCVYRLDGRGYHYEKDFATLPTVDSKIVNSKYTIDDKVTSTYKNKDTETFDVIYYANGGSGTMSESPKLYDVNYRLLFNQFTAPTGKQFKCWSVNGEEIAPDTLIGILGDTLVVAVWEDIPVYKPIFESQPTNQSGKIGAKVNLPVAIDVEQVPNQNNTIILEVQNGENWDMVQGASRSSWTGSFDVKSNEAGTKTYRYKVYDGTKWSESDTFTVEFTPLVVTFVDEVHSTTTPAIYVQTYDSLINKPADPTYPGDAFDVWQDSNYQTWDFATRTVTQDTVLRASWHDCGFRGNIPDVIVLVGEKAKIDLSNVNYNGVNTHLFIYDGANWTQVENITNYGWWMVNASAVAKTETYKVIIGYNTIREVQSNEFTVTWVDSAYTVSFDANGGSGTMENVGFIGTYTLPACTFTAPAGKQFKGWSTNPNGAVIEGDTYEIIGDIVFYAIWEDKVPTKITNVTITSNMEFVVGGDIPLNLSVISIPNGAGYHAVGVGWYDNTDDDWAQGKFVINHTYLFSIELKADAGYVFGETNEITAIVDGITAEVMKNGDKIMVRVVYGAPTYYTVTFNANGGSGTMETLQIAGAYVLPKCTFAPPVTNTYTYTFDCWSVSNVGSKQVGETIIITSDITITAIWKEEPIVYTVTFNAGGGSGEMQSKSVNGGDSIILPECQFTPADEYTVFLHWEVSEVGAREVGYELYVLKNYTITAVWTHKCKATPVSIQNPNCATETNGKEAYFVCEGCSKNYQDENCQQLISDLESWGNIAWEHDYTGDKVYIDENSHGYKCSNAQCESVGSYEEHTLSGWQSNGTEHYKTCDCLGVFQKENCSGGSATCTAKAICEVCNNAYGSTLDHEYGDTWQSDADKHWQQCACGDKSNESNHEDDNNDGQCDVCGYQMGTPQKDNDGLGAGGIIAIVVGGVVVLGLGGFAILWFVIKKKSFADLLAIFAKK